MRRAVIRQRVKVFLLMASLAVPGTGGAEDIASLYEKALMAANEGETRAAIIHLKNALQSDDGYLAAHILLGRLYLKENQPELAERALQKANRLGADRALTALPLARAYLQQRKYQRLLEDFSAPDFPATTAAQLLILQGKAFVELDQTQNAVEALEEATRLDPQAVEAYLGLAEIALRAGDLRQAARQLALAKDLAPADAGVYFVEASLRHAQGQLQKALQAYTEVLRLLPTHPAARLARAGLYLDLGRPRQALEDVQALLADYPDDPRAAYLKAVLLNRLGDARAAAAALREAGAVIDRLPPEMLRQHAPSLMLAGLVSFNLGEYEKARDHLGRYVKRFPRNPAARKLLGATLLRQGDAAAAVRVLEPAAQNLPDDARLLALLGDAYMAQGRHDLAAMMFERALQQRDDVALRRRQALNDLARNRPQQALDQLMDVFRRSGHTSTGLMAALLQARNGNFEHALSLARQLVQASPGDPVLQNFLASMQMATGRAQEARQTLQELVARRPSLLAAQINLARLDSAAGEHEAARMRLRELLRRQPGAVVLMLELSRLAQRMGDEVQALRWAEKALAADSRSIAATLRLVELHLAREALDEALAVLDTAQQRAPDDVRLRDALARVHLARGETRQARMILRRLSTDVGYNGKLLYRIARLQLQARDPRQAIWSLQKAIDGAPDLLPAHVLLAEVLLQRGNLELAGDIVATLGQRFPRSAEGLRLAGDLALRRGDVAAAIETYEQALQIQESNLITVRLAEAHRLAGHGPKARKVLQRWLERHPDDLVAREALAEQYLLARRWQEAAGQYEAVLELQPRHALALNNLAVIYADSDTVRALDYARKAHRLLPKAPFTNDTLGWLLTRSGRAQEGIGYLRAANARQASNAEFQYHLAVALHQLGRIEEARQELDRALAYGQAFEGLAHARALRESLL